MLVTGWERFSPVASIAARMITEIVEEGIKIEVLEEEDSEVPKDANELSEFLKRKIKPMILTN